MHIVLIAPVRYEFLHQRPQKLADQFLANGIGVTYVQPSGFKRALRGKFSQMIVVLLTSVWYHLLGMLSLILPEMRKRPKESSASASRPDLEIISLPVTYPINRVDSPALEALTAAVFRQFLLRRILARAGNDTVAIVQTPFWGTVFEPGDCSSLCYDCLDDVSLAAGNASRKRFADYEQRLMDLSTCVTATAGKLESRLRLSTEKPIHRIPNGVDYEWFQKRAQETSLPDDIGTLPRPVVGYVGHIAAWLDYQLITTVAQSLPEVSFVFIGPLEFSNRLSDLKTAPNIVWLGEKHYADVPAYIKAFDVCMIPFKHGDIAQTTNPVKLYEYFALGKPVVCTILDELIPYASNGLALLADSSEKFAQYVREALGDRDQSREASRMKIAKNHSWTAHALSFIQALNQGEL